LHDFGPGEGLIWPRHYRCFVNKARAVLPQDADCWQAHRSC
jgi:hypothetical protein